MAIKKVTEITCDFCSKTQVFECNFDTAETLFTKYRGGVVSIGRHFCSNKCCNDYVSFIKEYNISKKQLKAFEGLRSTGMYNMHNIEEGAKYINEVKKVPITEKEYEYILQNYSRLYNAKYTKS